MVTKPQPKPSFKDPGKFVMPTLGPNTTPEYLVDELGKARAHKKHWEAAEEFYKESLKGRTSKERAKGKTSFQGDLFLANFEEKSRTGLDTTAIKDEMGEDWVKEHSATTDYTQITTKRV